MRRAEAVLAEALGRDEERGALLQEREGLRARLAAAAEEAAELRRACTEDGERWREREAQLEAAAREAGAAAEELRGRTQRADAAAAALEVRPAPRRGAAAMQRAQRGGVWAGTGAAHGGGGSGGGAGVGGFEPRLRGRRAARAGLCSHKRIGVGRAGDQLPPPPFLLNPGACAAPPPLQPTIVAAQTLESESRDIDTYTRCFNLIHDRIVQGEVPPEQFLFSYLHISPHIFPVQYL